MSNSPMCPTPPRLPVVAAVCSLLIAASTVPLLLSGCQSPATGKRNQVPEWVNNPAALEAPYPRSRFFLGFAVCGGASDRDVMSREQVQKMAVADIASVVEVQINDVVEQQNTDVTRNGKHLVQDVVLQNTRREVTGILSGVEVKGVYFNEKTLNWHAYAVLERAQAGRGAVEAVNQRVARIDDALAKCGQGPLTDYVNLSALLPLLTDLDRLEVAVAIFYPVEKASVAAKVTRCRQEVGSRRAAAAQKLAVQVCVGGVPADAAGAFRQAAERVLTAHGMRVSPNRTGQQFDVAVALSSENQVGSVRLVKISAEARYALREDGREVFAGVCPAGEATSSRAATREVAELKSIEKLQAALGQAVARDLDRMLSDADSRP